jgi:hypothetical protein
VGMMTSGKTPDGKQVIEVYDFKEKHIRIPRGWELRVQGRFAKLATKLWDLCRKKGWIVQSYMNDTRMERILIDSRDLMDNIMQQYEGSLFRDHDPEMVIIGRDTFRKMMNIRELSDYCGGPLSLTATAERWNQRSDPRQYPGERPVKTMFNIPVRVVSNMEGMVIVDRGR